MGLITFRRWPVLLLVTILVTPADAWWDSGHRVVALIADSRLAPRTRARLLEVLGQHPQVKKYFTPPADLSGLRARRQWTLTQAAVWPDAIRGTDRDRPTWHYVNLPLFLSTPDQQQLAGRLRVNVSRRLPAGVNLETRGLNVIQAISFCRKQIVRDDVTDADKAICVAWLCHLVGDVHQPCHSTAVFTGRRFLRGDRGGNDIPLVGDTNLHKFWDSQLGNSRAFGNEVVRRAASLLADRELVAAGMKAEKNLSPVAWVSESHALARQVAYHPLILAAVRQGEFQAEQEIPAIRLPEDYARQATRVSQRRGVEAGFRLARVLAELR